MTQRRDLLLEPDQVQDVDEQPGTPCDETPQFQPADVGHRPETRDRGHAPLVEVAERLLLGFALEPGADLARAELGPLHGHLRHTRQVVERDHVAEHEHLGVTGQCQIRLDLHTTGTVHVRPALLSDLLAQRRGLHAGGPDHAARGDVFDASVAVADLHPRLVHGVHEPLQPHVDAHLRQLLLGLDRLVCTEAAQDVVAALDEDDAGLPRIDVPEVVLDGAPGEFDDLPGQLHPRGPRADDHKRHPRLHGVRIGFEFCHLEGPVDPRP